MGEPGGNCAPRWEWRTFGARLPEIEAKLGPTTRIARGKVTKSIC